jgi:hypothetical protein
MHAFRIEFEKIALQTGTHEERIKQHFSSPEPDWDDLERGIRSRKYQKLLLSNPKSDPKLKAYVENFGGYLRSPDVAGRVRSPDSGHTYIIKKLKSGRLACGCGDWQYKHSHQGTDCKHLKLFKAGKVKSSGVRVGPLGTAYLKNTRRFKLGRQTTAATNYILQAPQSDDSKR